MCAALVIKLDIQKVDVVAALLVHCEIIRRLARVASKIGRLGACEISFGDEK